MLGLFGVCMAAALLELLLPDNGHRGARIALRLLVALSVLVLVLTPLFSSLRELDPEELAEELTGEACDEETYKEVFKTLLDRAGEADLADGIGSMVAREYGVPSSEVCVSVAMGEDGALRRIGIRLSGSALLIDPREVEALLATQFSCEIEVR